MKRLGLVFGLVLCLLLVNYNPVTAGIREDTDVIVKKKEIFYEVNYPNGNKDDFVLCFEVHLKCFMQQTGRASQPYKLRFTDDRECNYKVEAYYERRGYFVTGRGHRIPFEPARKLYGAKESKNSDESWLDTLVGGHTSCNEYITKFNNAKQRVKGKAITAFTDFIAKELPKSIKVKNSAVATGDKEDKPNNAPGELNKAIAGDGATFYMMKK